MHAISDMALILADRSLPVKRFLQRLNVKSVRDPAMPFWVQLDATVVAVLIWGNFGGD